MNKHLTRSLIVLLCLALASVATAGPYDEGVFAARQGEYLWALRLWLPLAEEGNPQAQNAIGELYEGGHGVPEDFADAAVWYRESADQGFARAQSNLGLAYALGRGLPRDYAQAMLWYRRAASQGNALAEFNIGLMYAKGAGVLSDSTESV
jgi:TPR repeat protein